MWKYRYMILGSSEIPPLQIWKSFLSKGCPLITIPVYAASVSMIKGISNIPCVY